MKTKEQVLNQIRGVIINIINGRYEHNQESWHCGTASCIAGWCQLEDVSEELGITTKQIRETMILPYDRERIDGYWGAENHVLNQLDDQELCHDIAEDIFLYRLTLPKIIDGFNGILVKHKINVSPIVLKPEQPNKTKLSQPIW